jgi:dTDP-glucose 4,6-dehydratase
MKNILVTGGCGFIGSNFIRYSLDKTDWKIVNLDALTYAGNIKNLSDIETNKRYKFIHGNICDKILLEKIFNEENINGVIHFAAESHVDNSIINPIKFVETNVIGTCNLLNISLKEWNRGNKKGFKFHHISTDEVFGSLGKNGYFSEMTSYDPSSPYSASKASSDHFVKAWNRTYGLPIVITNCSNNYGPYQHVEKMIPLMISNIIKSKSLPVYGDGKNIRDWLYVIDHCDALLEVFNNGKIGETYNIGGNEEKENIEIVNILCDLIDEKLNRKNGYGKKLIKFVKDRPGHDKRYAIDASKIKKELGWKPKYKFEDALNETVDWYLNKILGLK